jgi:hypothetical protein
MNFRYSIPHIGRQDTQFRRGFRLSDSGRTPSMASTYFLARAFRSTRASAGTTLPLRFATAPPLAPYDRMEKLSPICSWRLAKTEPGRLVRHTDSRSSQGWCMESCLQTQPAGVEPRASNDQVRKGDRRMFGWRRRYEATAAGGDQISAAAIRRPTASAKSGGSAWATCL